MSSARQTYGSREPGREEEPSREKEPGREEEAGGQQGLGLSSLCGDRPGRRGDVPDPEPLPAVDAGRDRSSLVPLRRK